MESELKTYSTVIGVILICTLNPLLMVFGVITLIKKRVTAPKVVKIFSIIVIVCSAVLLIYHIINLAGYFSLLEFYSGFPPEYRPAPNYTPYILPIVGDIIALILCPFTLKYLSIYTSQYTEMYPDHFSYDP